MQFSFTSCISIKSYKMFVLLFNPTKKLQKLSFYIFNNKINKLFFFNFPLKYFLLNRVNYHKA